MSNDNNEKLQTGYIRLFRRLINWEWYTDVNVCHLFIHCLLKANFQNKEWRGMTIKAGSFVTSYSHLSNDTGLTIREVRTALNKLKTTQEVTCKTTRQNTIITVNNWFSYQKDDTQNDNQTTHERHTSDTRATTTNNVKNDNNDNNEKKNNNNDKSLLLLKEKNKKIFKKKDFKKFGEFKNVFLTEKEEEKLKAIYTNRLNEAIDILSAYIASKNVKYKSHYAVLCRHNWVYRKMYKTNGYFNNSKTYKKEEENNGYTYVS